MNRDQLYAYASSKLSRVGGTREPYQPRLPARPGSRSMGPTPPLPTSADESHFSAYFSMGKQKLISAVKTTKESSYYKTISTAIQQNFTTDQSVPLIPENPEIADDAEITMYKSYSRFTGTEYVTEIVGSVSSPGTMSRKNRLLISLVQKLAKPNGASTATVNQFEHELKDSLANPETKTSNTEDSDIASTYSSSLASSSSTDIIKDRLQGVMSRSSPRTPLKITVGSDVEVDHLLGAHLYTDPIGFFQISIATPYPPSYIVVSSTINPEIMQTTPANIIEPTGVSVISDVDDTVRITGVTAERREVFRNIFAKDFSECEVPGLGEWYRLLNDEHRCCFHYVSNSPWQVYNIVSSFIDYACLPCDSIHLRQYSGNLIQSFMQPSSERKKGSIVKIFSDFPHKKFVLIGDSGEQDLEAYLSIASMFPDRVLGIYIRALDGAFSSLGDDYKVYKELQETLQQRKKKHVKASISKPSTLTSQLSESDGLTPKNSQLDLHKTLSSTEHESLVEAAHHKKVPPLPPSKPDRLKGDPVHARHGVLKRQQSMKSIGENDFVPPLLPRRKTSSSTSINSVPPVPTRRRTTIPDSNDATATQKQEIPDRIPMWGSTAAPVVENDDSQIEFNEYGEIVTDEFYDKKKTLWKERIDRVVNELPETIEFKFWWDARVLMDHSSKMIDTELKRQLQVAIQEKKRKGSRPSTPLTPDKSKTPVTRNLTIRPENLIDI
ncbi:unnamed protein product [Ambrosiozyma monospora]|uniref:Unnamed protein product n=1 Tax=Ambrosiozyma monospora TaxID=43982 RepID=A0A9W7DCG2_AMBMO|nr:unnamed protein product [Ambrosiozyma monospora]